MLHAVIPVYLPHDRPKPAINSKREVLLRAASEEAIDYDAIKLNWVTGLGAWGKKSRNIDCTMNWSWIEIIIPGINLITASRQCSMLWSFLCVPSTKHISRQKHKICKQGLTPGCVLQVMILRRCDASIQFELPFHCRIISSQIEMLQFIGKAYSKKLRSNATIIWINLSWEQTKLVGDFYQKVSSSSSWK